MKVNTNIFLTSIQIKEKKEFESSFILGNSIKKQNKFAPKWKFVLSENNKTILKNVQKKDWFLFYFDGNYSFASQVFKKPISVKSNTKSSLIFFENVIKINRGYIKTNRELEIKSSIPLMHKISLLSVKNSTTQKILKKYQSVENFLFEKKPLPNVKKTPTNEEYIKRNEIVIQAASIKKPPKRIKTFTNRIIRDTIKSKKLKIRYENKCQVCRLRIFDNYSDVHHIWPIGEKPIGGDDDYDNMLVLCPNHHAMFDLALIKIKNSKKKFLIDINGKKVGKLYFQDDHNLHPKNIQHNNMRVERTHGT